MSKYDILTIAKKLSVKSTLIKCNKIFTKGKKNANLIQSIT